jgi:hypothetical protein
MQKMNSIVLVIIVLLVGAYDLNLVDPILGLGVDVVNDHIPIVGNLDESILTVIATIAGQELIRRRKASKTTEA